MEDLIRETEIVNMSALKLPMDAHLKLTKDQGMPLQDGDMYKRLNGKLIYLTITSLDISYTIQVLNQLYKTPPLTI